MGGGEGGAAHDNFSVGHGSDYQGGRQDGILGLDSLLYEKCVRFGGHHRVQESKIAHRRLVDIILGASERCYVQRARNSHDGAVGGRIVAEGLGVVIVAGPALFAELAVFGAAPEGAEDARIGTVRVAHTPPGAVTAGVLAA